MYTDENGIQLCPNCDKPFEETEGYSDICTCLYDDDNYENKENDVDI